MQKWQTWIKRLILLLEREVYIFATDFNVSRETLRQLKEFERFALLYNRTQNLYSKRDVAVFWERHILDSLKINDLLKGESSVADIGSGGGLPGIPLAISNSEKTFFLIERRENKGKFLLKAKEELGLKNVVVLLKNFDEIKVLNAKTFVSRGVRLEKKLIDHAKQLCIKGRYIYFKGESFSLKNYLFLKNHSIEEKKGILIVYL